MCGSSAAHHKVLGKRLNASQGRHPARKSGITTTIMRCTRCGLIFSNPLPIPENIQDHYGIPPESYWTEEYRQRDKSVYLPGLEKLKQEITSDGPLRSLDIGAGLGRFVKACAEAGFEAWGCEASEPFHQRAIEKMQIPKDKLILGKVEDVEFPENYFDYISLKAVLEHLTDPSLVLARSIKWLKPGGVVMVAGPSSNWMISKWFDRYYSLRGLDYTTHLSPMHTPFHLYEFGLKSFEYNAKESGYYVHHYHYDVCETFLPLRFNGLLKWIMRKNNSGMDITVLLKKNA